MIMIIEWTISYKATAHQQNVSLLSQTENGSLVFDTGVHIKTSWNQVLFLISLPVFCWTAWLILKWFSLFSFFSSFCECISAETATCGASYPGQPVWLKRRRCPPQFELCMCTFLLDSAEHSQCTGHQCFPSERVKTEWQKGMLC